jgi:hypothetical protein
MFRTTRATTRQPRRTTNQRYGQPRCGDRHPVVGRFRFRSTLSHVDRAASRGPPQPARTSRLSVPSASPVDASSIRFIALPEKRLRTRAFFERNRFRDPAGNDVVRPPSLEVLQRSPAGAGEAGVIRSITQSEQISASLKRMVVRCEDDTMSSSRAGRSRQRDRSSGLC